MNSETSIQSNKTAEEIFLQAKNELNLSIEDILTKKYEEEKLSPRGL